MNKFIFSILIVNLFINFAYATDSNFDQYFQLGLNAGSQHKQQAEDAFRQFNAPNTFKNYTNAPQETHYYGGITQSTTPIKKDAVAYSSNNEVVKSIRQVDANQQHIDKEALQQEINRITKIQDNAYDIVRGISNDYADCTNQESCTMRYEEKQCEEVPETTIQYCKKTLNIDVIPYQNDTHYTIGAHLSVKDHNYAGVSVNLTNNVINFLGPHEANFQLYGLLPPNLDCHTLSGKIISMSGDAHLDSIHFPSPTLGLNLDFHISGGHNIDILIDITSSTITYTPKDREDDGCLGLSHLSNCTFQSEQCVQPGSTKIIQGIPVARACWENELKYLCNSGGISNESCAPLRNQGCEQINSECKEKSDGGCKKYIRTYRCPIKQCKNIGIICNGSAYCLDGECVKRQKQPDADFQKAVSVLSSSIDAGKQFDQHVIFAGKVKSCRNFMLGAAYCCSDDGWLVNTHLMGCSQEEKELGNAKENGMTHYIGRFEEGCVAGICAKKIKTYCTFPSKLARIIQEQGREQQLHRSFGNAEHPDCSGLTPEELQKIDFSKIDFKDFYDDIAKKQSIEDQEKINTRIQDKMKHLIDEGQSHDNQ